MMDDPSNMSLEGMQCIISVYEAEIKDIHKANPFAAVTPFQITWRMYRIKQLREEIDRRLDIIPMETLMAAIDGKIHLTII